jgi:hypothetical protein
VNFFAGFFGRAFVCGLGLRSPPLLVTPAAAASSAPPVHKSISTRQFASMSFPPRDQRGFEGEVDAQGGGAVVVVTRSSPSSVVRRGSGSN